MGVGEATGRLALGGRGGLKGRCSGLARFRQLRRLQERMWRSFGMNVGFIFSLLFLRTLEENIVHLLLKIACARTLRDDIHWDMMSNRMMEGCLP